ncbi:MAG TPA: hypothetical protein VNA20_07465 [Frankiaceae bacterium]|nr:hypothetical protein [Frankiaceae bacterium]
MTVIDYGELVAALRAVPGVADADVAPDGDGGLGLLRLGLAPGYDEIQVATTVGRLLRERFGLGVDAEHVQLVEDAASPMAPVAAGAPPQSRPAIERMHVVSEGTDVAVSVTLGFGGRSFVGEAEGPATQPGVNRAVALATLRSVEGLVDARAKFELDHLEVTQTGDVRTAVAVVSMVTPGGSERLTGAALVREDVRQAVIRATLDGLNRRIAALLR